MTTSNNTLQALSRKLGPYQKRNNGEYGFECPKCSRGKGRFHMGVNLDKGVFNCFRCGHAGNIRSLGVEVQNLRSKRAELAQKLELPPLPGFVGYGSDKMPLPVFKQITNFMKSRGISSARSLEMGVGYSIDPKLAGRVLLPVRQGGAPRYWVARLLCNDEATVAKDGPKEIGPKNGLGWDKRSDVLYGIDDIPERVHVVLVEGIFDAEYLKSLGYHALSLLGSNISEVQIGKILSTNPAKISLFFDGDDGGRHGAKRSYDMIKARFRGWLKVVDTPDGIDPDDCSQKMCKMYLDSP